jgi:hypothetical protein
MMFESQKGLNREAGQGVLPFASFLSIDRAEPITQFAAA